MIDKVINFIDKNSMLAQGDKVVVALSGGPDSICLIDILNKLKGKYDIELFAAHLNHCLRGEEADADEQYAKEFCSERNIAFYSKRVDINKLVKEKNISSETAGRQARYEFFNELKDKIGAQKIAIAHNSNDQAETLLMRLIRGSGIEGMNGIKPVRDSIYIRPILILNRNEIESYCEENQLKPRIDKTNYENIYNRNKIRLELIPYIQENFNKDIVSTLNRFSYLISVDDEFINDQVNKKFNNLCEKANNSIIIKNSVKNEKEAITSRIIRKAITSLIGSTNDIEMINVYDVMKLFELGTGKKVDLPRGLVAENVYGQIHIYLKGKEGKGKHYDNMMEIASKEELVEGYEKSFYSEQFNLNISLRVINSSEKLNFSKDSLTKYFDCDKIRSNIVMRYRKEGDRFTPYGMTGSKKLKDLFIDLKIPKTERENIPLICIDNDIAWVVGYRVSNNFIISKTTKNVLELKVEGETLND
ncbi:tRNA lysidine(34) synthetase TilS [Clostridium sp. 19966]|uniref:tRNA lysidine(34) synthetase TilS n=1 Tax=Clostridium sp. 19966 TaxID=2768166 RepID=UPI0028DE539A|nr:tRNA lysidine(34) synthetase TilS [Clostridium sp. 19966]MDT8715752.1 tRNA lysidine(34) synthetase TilS [Clostridium sp. 19966]